MTSQQENAEQPTEPPTFPGRWVVGQAQGDAINVDPWVAAVDDTLRSRGYGATGLVYDLLPLISTLIADAERRGRDEVTKQVVDWLAIGGTDEVENQLRHPR